MSETRPKAKLPCSLWPFILTFQLVFNHHPPYSTVPREAAPPIRMQEAEVDGFSKEVRAASPQRCCRGPVVWGTRSRNAFPTRELHPSRGGVVSPEAFQVHVFPEFSWKATRGMVTDDRCCLSQPVPPSVPPARWENGAQERRRRL